MQYGDGVKKKFLKIKSPTILQKDRDVSLAPSTKNSDHTETGVGLR